MLLRPRLVITLGKFAFNALCPKETYGKALGTVKKTPFGGRKLNVFPIYHPSGMNLSQKARKVKFEKDVALMCKLIKHWEKELTDPDVPVEELQDSAVPPEISKDGVATK